MRLLVGATLLWLGGVAAGQPQPGPSQPGPSGPQWSPEPPQPLSSSRSLSTGAAVAKKAARPQKKNPTRAAALPRGWDRRSRVGFCAKKGMSPPNPADRVPFHLHVHKSGGSLYCHLPLFDQKLRRKFKNPAEVEARGCNQLGDGPATVAGVGYKRGRPAQPTASGAFANRDWCCEDRYARARQFQSPLIAREFFTSGPPCPKFFIHTIVLRTPLSNMVSHRSFHQHTSSQLKRWTTNTTFTECWNAGTSDNYGPGEKQAPTRQKRKEEEAGRRLQTLDYSPLGKSSFPPLGFPAPSSRKMRRNVVVTRSGMTNYSASLAAEGAEARSKRSNYNSYAGPERRCATPTWPLLHGTAIYDNLRVRLLGGEGAYFKPLRSVDQADLEVAKSVLRQYEVVVRLEHFDEDLVQLQEVLGWKVDLEKLRRSGTWAQWRRTTPEKLPFTPSETALLTELNSLDEELYEFAAVRAQELTQAATKRRSKKAKAKKKLESLRLRDRRSRRRFSWAAFLIIGPLLFCCAICCALSTTAWDDVCAACGCEDESY